MGPPVVPARDAVLEAGIVINGLPIAIKSGNAWSPGGRDLVAYYRDCVIGGPGSFMIPITTQEEFATATRRKLLLEISNTTPKERVVPVQLGPPPAADGYDCGLLERGRRW